MLNSTTTEIYHSGVGFDPADHPYNDDVTIAWPHPLMIILEHHKAFAIKRAVAEALVNAMKPESRPDQSADKRIDELKNKISESDRGDKLSKQMICWLLDKTENLTKPAGLKFPDNCFCIGSILICNAISIMQFINWSQYVSPYRFVADALKGKIFITDASTGPLETETLKFIDIDLITLNQIARIRA